ncbi:BlaR1 family beta-lactam sensor/signal transducer [Paenibacillus sp. PL91]|uniref:BlaR1 family beta-lactam sensor/signal transducer n=1 Tax=Paenibacillus sp. PL91 TaxID=2729538 RepID=UPI00145CF868|nr:BlaR1 family beta-lactam sensor/signal transducer [Paenibacillus sp. PL91]MBC9203752.1 BlaR1 family beta-lactam sensor/signal transducer [Paenibacillus sp. PL91]
MLNLVVISFVVSSFTAAVIMLVKKVFRRQLSAGWQYNLWFLWLIALALPFIPSHYFHIQGLFDFNAHSIQPIDSSDMDTGGQAVTGGNWLQDFTVSVHRKTPANLNTIILILWIAGSLVCSVMTVLAWLKINNIRRTAATITNKEVISLFEQCKQSLNITRPLVIAESPLIQSPMTFGLLKTYVVLPVGYDEWLSLNEIKYILLHELHHYKNKDIWTNYLIVIYQLLYWYNPLIWIAFREMRLDREIACDTAVLKSLDEYSYVEYGNTIINFADRQRQDEGLAFASQLHDSMKQLKKRIHRIASFTTESRMSGQKSIAIFILAGLFVSIQVPLVSAMSDDQSRYRLQDERVSYEDLNTYFAGYEGSFVLYDRQTDQYIIYNKDRSTLRVSPDSTYKIFLSLYGLEAGLISGENTLLKWNGIQYPYDAWNRDQNLFTAMSSSVNWYFQELDRGIPQNLMQHELNRIGYGNGDLSGGTTQYWMESSLKISPVEQVRLLQSFYTNQFGFHDDNVQTVKDSIRLSENEGRVLSGKTGTGAVNGKNINGWFIGYVEDGENTYFFATNIANGKNSGGSEATAITLSILKDKGIY